MTMADDMTEAVLTTIKELQRTIIGQQSLMMQIFRNGERIEKRVEMLDRRFGSLEQRMNETNERMSDLKDELALMLKMELSGWSANFETKLDQRFDRIEDRLEALETKLP